MSSRTQIAANNAIWAMINKAAVIVFPFVIRTIMIYTWGAEYLGLNSLFKSALSILNIAELGIGSAIVYAMYKPIAENNEEMVCALLNLYRKIYRVIGVITLACGVLLLPFMQYLIADEVPEDINIYILYIIYLVDTSCGYFLFSYQKSALNANQRDDLINKVNVVINVIKSVCQILVLLLCRNYYLYAVFLPAASIGANVITAYMAHRLYPQYTCRGMVSGEKTREIRKNVSSLFVSKITGTIYIASDSVVVSAFLGLVTLAKYNNYYYIMSAVSSVVSGLFRSVTATVGNSIVLESDKKNYRDYMNLSFINAWLTGWCTACLFCLYQPFIKLWVGEELMFGKSMVGVFCLYFYVQQLNVVQNVYRDAAGLWKEDMWRSCMANIFDIVANIVLVQLIGVYGVLLSTIISLLVITYPWQTWTLHKKLFHCSMRPYIKKLLAYTVITAGACWVTDFVCDRIVGEGIGSFIAKMIVCCMVPNVVFLICYFRTSEIRIMAKTILKAMKKV